MEIKDLKKLKAVRAAAADGQARKTRVDAGVTQGEVAEAVGVAQSTVAQWERGARRPRGLVALRYAAVLKALEDGAPTPSKDDG
ncbi:helix-turn-helix transcriptional regulator [Actinomadura sp. 3N508]|uniref:helix-turn-helix transcriptional regulator n=1 Tax=Actinomadura sp. 3N508 TaxID=3375153 RepID=UPI00378E92E1